MSDGCGKRREGADVYFGTLVSIEEDIYTAVNKLLYSYENKEQNHSPLPSP
jgi:hypothetical protein